MRVIAGTAKSIRLKAIQGEATRPVLDRVKESLFSLLGARERIGGARVLDLYAGSGSLGIEALSRGAHSATFVERDIESVRMLESNLDRTGLSDKATVVHSPVASALTDALPAGGTFDLVFFDPPFAHTRSGVDGAVAEAAAVRLATGGLLIVRHETDGPQPQRFGPLTRTDVREWGKNAVSFYARPEQAAS